MKNNNSNKKSNKKITQEKSKKVITYIVIGILVFTMIFGSFSYLIYAIENV